MIFSIVAIIYQSCSSSVFEKVASCSELSISEMQDKELGKIFVVNKFTGEKESLRNHPESLPNKSIKYIIIHTTECNLSVTLDIFTSYNPIPPAVTKVCSHYIITQKEDYEISKFSDTGFANYDERVKNQKKPEKFKISIKKGGNIIRMADDNQLARHAGISFFNKDEDLNTVSIGIELVHEQNQKFDKDQINALVKLLKLLTKKYDIKPENILAHSDIAPSRKHDPGPQFSWGNLFKNYGIGAWLSNDELNPESIKRNYKPLEDIPSAINEEFFFRMLEKFGYKVKGYTSAGNSEEAKYNKSIVTAFKAHFSENLKHKNYSDIQDNLTYNDMFWAWALVSKYRRN